VQLLEKFIEEYYDQNPISQLGLITLCNKRAEKVSELSGWFYMFAACRCRIKQVALLWQRDRAPRLSVEILQLQNIPFEN